MKCVLCLKSKYIYFSYLFSLYFFQCIRLFQSQLVTTLILYQIGNLFLCKSCASLASWIIITAFTNFESAFCWYLSLRYLCNIVRYLNWVSSTARPSINCRTSIPSVWKTMASVIKISWILSKVRSTFSSLLSQPFIFCKNG